MIGHNYNPAQLPLWPEKCKGCGRHIEADLYGVWHTVEGPVGERTAFCDAPGEVLHTPGGH